ncbi:MAG: DUF1501 domain-containing protein [Pirellulales bacterium]
MLQIVTDARAKTCDRATRRDFLAVGALGLAGLTLSQWLSLRAMAASEQVDFVRDKSVVLLYLSGGASHIETFDPHIGAPAGVRSLTGEAPTKLAGVTFGGTFPQLAARADKLAVVRSFQHPVGDHDAAHVHVLSGGTNPTGKGDAGFSMSAAFARLRGANHPATGLPTNVFLGEDEVDGQYRNERQRALRGSAPGVLGPSYAPLVHHTADEQDDYSAEKKGKNGKPSNDRRGNNGRPKQESLAANMQLNMPAERLHDRRLLLAQLDRINRGIDASGMMDGLDKFNAQATELLLGGAADAFDFRKENPSLVERYDTSDIRIGHKVFRTSTLGRQMLVARRLCEAGCGFVTVHSAGWDMHADGNNPGIVGGMEMLGRSVDRAVSAFLDDVDARGLSDKILLVITGDFGRTPKVNNRGGRDHWAKLGTLAFAGGGLNMGQAIGQSLRGADAPATEPISAGHLMATVMHALFDVGQLRLARGLPRDLTQRIESGEPIRELF